MRTTYVPFAIKHPCLLACIFYISYHRRYLNTDDPGEAARCHLLMQHYRLACIEMMKSALAVEEKPSAQTITLAMQLCSEAVSHQYYVRCRCSITFSLSQKIIGRMMNNACFVVIC
jgi:hypothetical protein